MPDPESSLGDLARREYHSLERVCNERKSTCTSLKPLCFEVCWRDSGYNDSGPTINPHFVPPWVFALYTNIMVMNEAFILVAPNLVVRYLASQI